MGSQEDFGLLSLNLENYGQILGATNAKKKLIALVVNGTMNQKNSRELL